MQLLIYSFVGTDISSHSSERSWHSQMSSLEASVVAILSMHCMTILCCFEDHEMAPPEQRNAFPETDQWLRQLLAQLALVYPMSSESPMVQTSSKVAHNVLDSVDVFLAKGHGERPDGYTNVWACAHSCIG